MFDFVKFKSCSLVAEKWLELPCLNFDVSVNYKTGAITGNKLVAKYNGLVFTVIYNNENLETIKYVEVSGSLHKYMNKGKQNYNDFTFYALVDVLNDLSKTFGISLEKAVLKNLEFAVNINTPIPATSVLKNLVAFKTFEFKSMSNGRKHIGKQIVTQKNRFKIYDKSKQSNLNGVNDLMRFEMHYNKMYELKKYNIKTLSDLTHITKITPLIDEILKRWDNIIYWDKSINIRHLNSRDGRRVLHSATPRNWSEYTKDQRKRAKKRFNDLMQLHGSNHQQQISVLIMKKWKELTAIKPPPFTQHLQEKKQQQNRHLLPVRMYGYLGGKYNQKNNKYKNQKKPEKTPKKKRVCKVCKKDIDQKRKGAIYCGKQCNNKFNGMRRTKQRQKARITELNNLEKVFKMLKNKKSPKIWLLITFTDKTTNITETVHLQPKEVYTSLKWVKCVDSVQITYRTNAPPIVLTSYRARKLIKSINILNINN